MAGSKGTTGRAGPRLFDRPVHVDPRAVLNTEPRRIAHPLDVPVPLAVLRALVVAENDGGEALAGEIHLALGGPPRRDLECHRERQARPSRRRAGSLYRNPLLGAVGLEVQVRPPVHVLRDEPDERVSVPERSLERDTSQAAIPDASVDWPRVRIPANVNARSGDRERPFRGFRSAHRSEATWSESRLHLLG